jgi:hypothetical protein
VEEVSRAVVKIDSRLDVVQTVAYSQRKWDGQVCDDAFFVDEYRDDEYSNVCVAYTP